MVLFYDLFAGEVEMYRSDDNGNLNLLNRKTGWRDSWDIIARGLYKL